MGWRRRRGWWGCPLLTPRVTPGVAIATHRVPISITNMMHMVPGHSCHSSNWSSNPAARGGLGSALCKNKVNNYWVFKTKLKIGIRYVLFSVIQRSSSSGTFHILLTPPRIDLLCMKNWGTQWTIDRSMLKWIISTHGNWKNQNRSKLQ